jgi:hypothetical protein
VVLRRHRQVAQPLRRLHHRRRHGGGGGEHEEVRGPSSGEDSHLGGAIWGIGSR